MSETSNWPLPKNGVRLLTQEFLLDFLATEPLTRDCYPTAMGYYPQAAGHRMRRERHDDNLLLYCTAGRGRVHADAVTLSVAAGDLVLLPAGSAHDYAASARDPWTLYWIHFRGAASVAFLDCLGYRGRAFLRHAGLPPALLTSFDNLLAVRSTGYSRLSYVNAANHIRHLFTLFALAARQRRPSTAGALDTAAIQAFMREHIDRRLTLDELAELANLSRFHFANRYKALTGYSPVRHFTHMKMEAACRLLDDPGNSVKAVGSALGYNDALYFSRAFKGVMGLSPQAYRESNRR